MKETALITGGAGFIGARLAQELLEQGYRVRALDNLTTQVHGPTRRRPDYLSDEVDLHIGDIRDPDAVRRALVGVDVVFHYAAAVGVGQSMYEIAHYTAVNNLGTAVLLEALAEHPVRKLVVASSMSLYGEGQYQTVVGETCSAQRTREQLANRVWEPTDAGVKPLVAIPTAEITPPDLASVYALSKFDQERLCLLTAQARDMAATALRFFNVYGPHQALSNPYTGGLAIFASRYCNNRPPLIFEDGEQLRDFVSVHDVARASRLALETPAADGQVINTGSGQARSINEIARALGVVLHKPDLAAEITGRYRIGDVRHCFSDISRARDWLGYAPRVAFEDGLAEIADWLAGLPDAQRGEDRVEAARNELLRRGLAV